MEKSDWKRLAEKLARTEISRWKYTQEDQQNIYSYTPSFGGRIILDARFSGEFDGSYSQIQAIIYLPTVADLSGPGFGIHFSEEIHENAMFLRRSKDLIKGLERGDPRILEDAKLFEVYQNLVVNLDDRMMDAERSQNELLLQQFKKSLDDWLAES